MQQRSHDRTDRYDEGIRADAHAAELRSRRAERMARDQAMAIRGARIISRMEGLDTSEPRVLPPRGTRWVRCFKHRTGPRQLPGWRWEAIDLGVADLVEQLQRPGDGGLPSVPTAACCEGHGHGEIPHVVLADGRVLAMLPDLDALRRVESADIHGTLALRRRSAFSLSEGEKQ